MYLFREPQGDSTCVKEQYDASTKTKEVTQGDGTSPKEAQIVCTPWMRGPLYPLWKKHNEPEYLWKEHRLTKHS